MALPFDQRDGVIWYDGKLVPWADAKLHVLSHGMHYASCVFEGERAYGGEIFKCTEHSERLRLSAELLDFEIPYSVAEIDAAKRLVIEKNGQRDAYVRPVAWRGSEMMAVSAQNTTIRLPELMARLPGGVPVSRGRLESLTQDLVDRTVWPCETVLRDAKWSVEDVDVLVMVGGQTNMPRVRAHIAEWLGKEPMAAAASPESLVAIGTARQGIALSAGRKRRKGEVA